MTEHGFRRPVGSAHRGTTWSLWMCRLAVVERHPTTTGVSVQLAKYPYPYRAMMAICSDLDETPNRTTYLEMMRFLNTTEQTSLGQGVGLEAGNSLYFMTPPGQYSYFGTDDIGRELARTLIRSGHID